MNLGTLSKDIWGLIFQTYEINFCPKTLNSLSLTCKKLNEIDKERRLKYINQYSDLDIELNPELKKGRQDHVRVLKYKNIDLINMSTKKIFKIGENYENVMFLVYPNLHEYLKILNVEKYEELFGLHQNTVCEKFDIPSKDLDLVCSHVSTEFIFAIFSLIKHKGDIVNAIMELQSFFL